MAAACDQCGGLIPTNQYAERDHWKSRAEAAEAKAKRRWELLKQLEWSGDECIRTCPGCARSPERSHAPSCSLAAEIGGGE